MEEDEIKDKFKGWNFITSTPISYDHKGKFVVELSKGKAIFGGRYFVWSNCYRIT